MSHFQRKELSELILQKLKDNEVELKENFDQTKDTIGYFFLDDLLPIEIANHLYDSFPATDQVTLKKSLKEYKYVAAQMNQYHPVLEEIIYAFQDVRVVEKIASICKMEHVLPDENLYAGGISMMGQDNFLHPHLDNSHDKDRNMWRILNLLYYVSPDWKEEYGGNLELWPQGLKEDCVTIPSKFNRLVVMSTHNSSWHSVNKVMVDQLRCCVSNYYFSNIAPEKSDHFHVTTFRARPKEHLKNFILKIDSNLRMTIRKVFKKGIRENPHVYKKDV